MNQRYRGVEVTRSLPGSAREDLRTETWKREEREGGKGVIESQKGKGKGERSERSDGERTKASGAERWRRGAPLLH